MTRIIAIDPGTTESAFMVLEDGLPIPGLFGKEPNADVRQYLLNGAHESDLVVIEEVRSYGMPVGREVFDTVRWCGRFEEAAASRGIPVEWLGRKDVVTNLCGSARAKDPNVHRALLDRFGGDGARGTKAHPGPLHGVSGDVWSALGVGCTWFDMQTSPLDFEAMAAESMAHRDRWNDQQPLRTPERDADVLAQLDDLGIRFGERD